MPTVANKKSVKEKLRKSDFLTRHQKAEEDYEPDVGTSDGLTSMDHPRIKEVKGNLADITDTDYSKP